MNVFIDGSAGTTGLRIRERLSDRADLTLLSLPEEARKDPAARRDCFLLADVIFLCLPDAAAIEAVSLMELPGQKEKIAAAPFIANPGCHATGFISLAAPLVAAGIVPADLPLSCFSLTGYTGGGKKMIAQYEEEGRDPLLDAPRQYGLPQKHKHLPEMAVYAGLSVSPAFCPIVADFPCGMEVTIPLFASQLKARRRTSKRRTQPPTRGRSSGIRKRQMKAGSSRHPRWPARTDWKCPWRAMRSGSS